MSLPEFNEFGDLPEGVHVVSLPEIITRFGSGSSQREAVTARLQRIYELAIGTGGLDRFIVFGSDVSDKLAPNNVDVFLMMQYDFHVNACSPEALALFDHNRAASELGASIFWVRPDAFWAPLDHFSIAHWQVKTGRSKAGDYGGMAMTRDDNEFAVTQERIAYLLGLLAQLRVTSRPDEFPLVASGYRAEVEQMQREVLDYLTRHSVQTTAKAS